MAEAKTPQEKEFLQRQITPTDKAIDSLVYELPPSGIISHKGTMYGLSQEEIRIMERGNSND